MTPEMLKPARVATAAGFDARLDLLSSVVENGSNSKIIQAEKLRQRFGLSPDVARFVASLAFSEARA